MSDLGSPLTDVRGISEMADRVIPEAARVRPPSAEQCAKERFQLPREWQWVHSARLGVHPHYVGIAITGGVYPEKITRGKRKGRPNFRKPLLGSVCTVSMSDEQIDAWTAQWEIETGLCAPCQGSGKEWRGWSIAEGTRYESCRRCKGRGTLPI